MSHFPKPMVDVVVLHWNHPGLLFEFMDAYLDSKPGCPNHLIHIDNGSTDPVWKGLNWWKSNTRWWNPLRKKSPADLHIYRMNSNLGFSGGCNEGAKRGQAPWILFLNNDAFPKTEGWLAQLVRTAEQTEAGAIGPIGDNVLGLQMARWNDKWPQVHRAKFLSGYAMMVRRETFEKIGGFDTRFFNGDEDLDISLRIRRAGRPVMIDRSVFVAHKGCQSLERLCRESGISEPGQWYQKTRQQLHLKWGEWALNDLFSWDEYRAPMEWWPKMGVTRSGFKIGRRGGAQEQLAAMAELSSRRGSYSVEAGSTLAELLSGRRSTHGYAPDRDTFVRGYGRPVRDPGCVCEFCRRQIGHEYKAFFWAIEAAPAV